MENNTVDVEKVIREYLPELVHMSLATSHDNAPWVCELHFAHDDKLNLYFRSLTSRRHSQEIAQNPKVAGNIVKQFVLGDAVVGVYFEGTARLLTTGDEQSKAFNCLKEKLHLGDEALAEAAREDGHQFYEISVENWYAFGRFDGPSAQKYKLAWHGNQ